MVLHRAEEDYIKTIYELSLDLDTTIVKTNEMSQRLAITDQSVNEMIKKLAKKDLLEFIPYKGVKLSQQGLDEAIRLVRAHRIWEVFLMEHLGFNWEDVHKEAELLEHAASNEVIDKLYDFIGKPKYCSHGNPIPDEFGNISKLYNKTLLSFNPGESFILKRVLDNRALLAFLNENKININDEFIIDKIDVFNGTISFKNHDLVISNKVAKLMFGI